MRSRKLFPIILCLVVILSVPSSFAATHASTCLSSYAFVLYAEGNGERDVEFEILGTNIMDKVGVYSLLIEEEVLPDVWVFHSIVYGEDNESTFFTENSIIHKDSYTFKGTPGLRYRVTLTAYAELGSDSDTGDVTSAARRCK